MGSGNWSEDTFRTYSRKKGRTLDRSGSLAGDLKNQDMFSARKMDPALDPNDVCRECCDTKEHPATLPVILALDVTGSMGQAAVEVAKRLNVIMTGLYKKLTDVEFMVMGIGDLAYDDCPLQVSQFESDIRIAEQLDKLYFEFGGGGNAYESYTAAWYFACEHCRLDAWRRGEKGIIITMGDEGINPYLPGNRLGEVTGRRIHDDVETPALYKSVREKYDVYHIFVRHGNPRDEGYIRTWREFMDEEHFKICDLESIADTIIRIVCGQAEGRINRQEDIRANALSEISW